MSDAPGIHLLVALPCEAAPLVSHFGLKRRMDETAFSIYARDGLWLTVSGVGKSAMAAAAAYCHVLSGKRNNCGWLNIGVAGHRSHAIGQAFIAHKISDDDSGQRWYPPLVFQVPCPSENLRTVSRPEVAYGDDCLYDMEAAGFFEAASRFASMELIQCLKMVSDNRANPANALKPKQVSQLVELNLILVEAMIERLITLRDSLTVDEPPGFLECRQRWHLTVQQTRELRHLLRRWQALQPGLMPDWPALTEGRQLLAWLRDQVEGLPLRLD